MRIPRRTTIVVLVLLLFVAPLVAWRWRDPGGRAIAEPVAPAGSAPPPTVTRTTGSRALPTLTSDDLPPLAGAEGSAAGVAPSSAAIDAAHRLGRTTMANLTRNYQRFQECRLGADNAALLAAPLVTAWPVLEQRMLAGDGGAAEALLERASMCESLRTSAKLAPGPERDRALAALGPNLDPATAALIDSISAEAMAWFDARSAGCGDGDFGMARLQDIARRRALASGHPDLAELDPKGGMARPEIFDRQARSDKECRPKRNEARLMAGHATVLPPDLIAIAASAVPPDGPLGSALAECRRRDCNSLAELPTSLQPELSELAEHLGLDDDLQWRLNRERDGGHADAVFGWLLYKRWLLLNSCEAYALPNAIAEVSLELQAAAASLTAGQRQSGLLLAQQLVANHGVAALRVRGCGP